MKYKLSTFIIFTMITGEVFATIQCSQIFPGGLSTTSGGITFNACTYIQGNPSTVLVTPNPIITNSSHCSYPTCYTAICTASGTAASQFSLGVFPNISSSTSVTVPVNQSTTIDGNNNKTTTYGTITLSGGSTLNFSANPNSTTLYEINTLTLNADNNVVNFVPGDYWIENFNCNNSATFNVVGTGTARLYFNGFNTSGTQNWNNTVSSVNSNPTPSQLLIVSYGGITFNNVANINGLIYANGLVIFDENGTINGAVTAQSAIFNQASNIIYNSSGINDLNFGTLCINNNNTTQFGVTAPSQGTNCQNMTITVTAENAQGQTQAGYNSIITLTTQNGTGTWVSTTGGGTFSGGTNNGVASYQFVTSDKGVASFQLNYPATGASPLTVEAYQTNSSGVSGFSNSINFIPTSMLVTAVAAQNPPVSPPPAFATTQVAGNNFTVFLTAYNPSNCGIITSYSGSKTLRFWTNFVNPASGTLNASINGTNIANSQSASQTTQAINFLNGIATVTGSYPDVGSLMLNVQDVSANGPGGVSGNFVVMPAQFAVNIPNDKAAQVFSPVASAVSACLADAAFAAAGRSFTVNVQPQNMQGNATPNYGNETPAQGIIIQSAALLAPNPGQNGSTNSGVIGNGSTFTKITSGGSPFSQSPFPYFTGSTFYFNEVGCISLTASVAGGSYLGAGNVVSNPLVVGRFIPDHFDASGNVPQFLTANNSASGSFTYLDQPFHYNTQPILTIFARALAGTTTQNYTGSFWKLLSTGFNPVYNKLYTPITATDTIPNLTLFSVIPAPTFVDGGNGTGTFTYTDGGGLTIQRPTTLPLSSVPPFKADIQFQIPIITDTDGVSCSGAGCTLGGFAFGSLSLGGGIPFTGNGIGNQFYHGRLMITDTIGSELIPMIIPLQTQFYTTANGFSINTLDSNTTLSAINSVLLTPSSAGLSTTPSFNPTTGLFQLGGNLNINLTPPTLRGNSSPGTFSIEINLSPSGLNMPWLQFYWPYNGVPSNDNVDPRADAVFGEFQGNDRIIYESEIFQ